MEDILIALGEYEVIFWFFAGALLSQIFSKLLAIVHVAALLKEVTDQILKLIGTTAEDVAFVKAMKFQALFEAGIDEEQIERVKRIDEHAFNNWKVSLITKLLVHYPKGFRYTLAFYDWDSAMKVLDDIYKQEARYEKKK
tara:strand:+ start:137 stop:556 length:420 start_codon:yes stop_codon:yes gene_type:complete